MSTFPTIGRHALRRGRISLRGQRYLLTTTTYKRRRLFLDPACARSVSHLIHAPTTWGDASLLAWVLMPDHWHGLLQLGDEPLARVMNRFKANAARTLHTLDLADGSIWDRSFHDHALRSDEDFRRVARYLVGNPIRAGLIASALDYPYWDCTWLDQDAPW